MLTDVKAFRSMDILSEVEFTATRSRGPGGQNVNKVSSAALLFWSFEQSELLSFEQKAILRLKLSAYINKEGVLYLRSDEYRDLPRNKERCLEKLDTLIERAFHLDKFRRPSKPTRSSKLKKQKSKSLRSDIKKNRQKNWSKD